MTVERPMRMQKQCIDDIGRASTTFGLEWISPIPKIIPQISSLGSLKRMGGTSKGLPFTFETSWEKTFHPPINKGPLYAKNKKHLSIVMLLIFSFEKTIFLLEP
jgi:hypothetical protein